MPNLPMDLYDESVKQIYRHMNSVRARKETLLVFRNNGNSIYDQIVWNGNRLDFTRTLVQRLTHSDLIQLLELLRRRVDVDQQHTIDNLCDRLRIESHDLPGTNKDSSVVRSYSRWSVRWGIIGVIFISLLYMSFIYRPWTVPQELFALLPSFLLMALAIGIVVSALPIRRHYLATFLITAPAPLLSLFLSLALNIYVETAQANGEFDPGPPGDRFLFADGPFVPAALFIITSSILFGVMACLGTKIGLWFQEKLFEQHGTSRNDKLITIITGCSSAIASIVIALFE